MGCELITPPDYPPISVEEAKSYLRIPAADTAEDADIAELIEFAAEWFSEETGLSVVGRGGGVYRLTLDGFPQLPCGDFSRRAWQRSRQIILPRPPLVSVESIKYLAGGVLTTWNASNYTVDATGMPGRVVLKPDASWPAADCDAKAVQINFTAGYGVDVPKRIRQAVRWLVGHVYENREATSAGVKVEELPFGVRSIVEAMTFREYVA